MKKLFPLAIVLLFWFGCESDDKEAQYAVEHIELKVNAEIVQRATRITRRIDSLENRGWARRDTLVNAKIDSLLWLFRIEESVNEKNARAE